MSTLIDKHRTQELNLDEVLVAADKGDNLNYYISLKSDFVSACPACSGISVVSNGQRTRKLADYIPSANDQNKFITLHYSYKKWQCNRSNCRSVFSKPITFAYPNAQTTIRLEEYIVRLALFMSFNKVPQRIGSTVTASAVKKIFLRWAERQESKFAPQTPKTLGIHPILIGNEMRLLICGIADEIQVLDILPDMSEETLVSFLRKLNTNDIDQIVTDMSESTWRGIHSVCPTVPILVANQYLTEFSHDTIIAAAMEELSSAYSNHIGRILTITPNDLTKAQNKKLQQIFASNANLEEIYSAIHSFLEIGNSISADTLDDWTKTFSPSSLTLNSFAEFIKSYIDNISMYNISLRTMAFPNAMRQYFQTLNDFSLYIDKTYGATFPVFRARMLYAYLMDGDDAYETIPVTPTPTPTYTIKQGFSTGHFKIADVDFTDQPTTMQPTQIALPELLKYLREKETQLKGVITNEQ